MIIRERTKDVIVKPRNVSNIVNSVLESMSEEEGEREFFFAFGLDTRNQVKYVDIVSIGTLNYNLVHPREVYRLAILKGCASIVVAHNHPSGCTDPSQEDIELTKRLEKAGELLGIELLDHVVVAKDAFYSFKEKRLL